MIIKLIILFISVFLISLSITFDIIYLNLLTMGYSFIDYVNFIIRRWECLIFIFGVILLYFIMRKGR